MAVLNNTIVETTSKEFDGDIIITDPCYLMIKRELVGKLPQMREYFSHEEISDYPDAKRELPGFLEDEVRDRISADPEIFDIFCEWTSEIHNKEYALYNKALREYYAKNTTDWERCEFGSEMEVLGFKNYMVRDTIYGDWSCSVWNTDTKEKIGNFCADAGLVGVFLLDEVEEYNPNFDYHINRTWTTTWIKNFKGTVSFVVHKEIGEHDDANEYHTKGELWEDKYVEIEGHGVDKATGKPINFIGKQTGF